MDHFRGSSLPENTRCLALHKIKARMIKNSMVRERMNNKQDNIGCKVIKYQTFLSQKLLNNIKNEELKEFQQQIKQFCGKKNSYCSSKSQACQQPLGIQKFMDEVKKQARMKLDKVKKRSKTQQNLQDNLFVFAQKSHIIRKQLDPLKIHADKINQKDIPDSIRNRKIIQKRFSVKGKIMDSHLVNLLEKMQQMNYYSNNLHSKFLQMDKQKVRDGIGSTQQLKRQQQRLTSANEKNERNKFKPIGRGTDDKLNQKFYHSQQKIISNHIPKIKHKSFRQHSTNPNSDPYTRKIQQTNKLVSALEKQIELKIKPQNYIKSNISKQIPVKGLNYKMDESYI